MSFCKNKPNYPYLNLFQGLDGWWGTFFGRHFDEKHLNDENLIETHN